VNPITRAIALLLATLLFTSYDNQRQHLVATGSVPSFSSNTVTTVRPFKPEYSLRVSTSENAKQMFAMTEVAKSAKRAISELPKFEE
jgi:hypothetical protein